MNDVFYRKNPSSTSLLARTLRRRKSAASQWLKEHFLPQDLHSLYIKEVPFWNCSIQCELYIKWCFSSEAVHVTIVIVRYIDAANLIITFRILNVVTTGLMEKWKSMHWPRNLWCVNAASYIVSTQPKTRKLTMDDCQGDYLILVCGLLAAIVAFIFEMYMKFRRKSENGNIQRKFLFKKGVPFVSPSEAGGPLLNGVKIIVIPVKEEYYNKLSTKPSQKL